MEFIKIENCSRVYDKNWENNGLMSKAINFCKNWADKQSIEGLEITCDEEKGKTPLIFGNLKANSKESKSIFMYGHIDKQPPLTETWSEGLHPYKPVIKEGKLYGRGSVDDGYAFFLSVILLKAMQKFNVKHGDITLFFECDEESDSIDIHHYLDKYKTKINKPDLIFCLDSGTNSYNCLSLTTTLRGVMEVEVKSSTLKEGIHSGDGSGVIPDNFRILNDLLDCFENKKNGQMNEHFRVIIPKDKYSQALDYSKTLEGFENDKYPFLNNVKPVFNNTFLNYMNSIWEPQLTVTGIDGIPQTNIAGNVLNPLLKLVFSIRLPPTLSKNEAKEAFENTIKSYKNKYNVQLEYNIKGLGEGWSSVSFNENLVSKLQKFNNLYFKNELSMVGQGCSIPFVKDLQDKFPNSELLVTGVLGPGSNAHGPDENLVIDYLEKFSIIMGLLLQDL